ncbi:MAG: PDZ domain-containing protein [Anaerohalosphaeraceae bacterium]
MKHVMIYGFILTAGLYSYAAAAVLDSDMIKQVQPSLVRVEYTLRFDKGDAPEVVGWGQRCPSCGQIHGYGDASQLIRQERPLEVAGFVLAADRVVTPDIMVHPRFVDKIRVRFQDELIDAKPAAYPLEQSAVILQLDKPLQKARPVAFAKSSAKAFKVVSYSEQNGQWSISVEKMQEVPTLREDGFSYIAGTTTGLIMDPNGIAAAVCMGQALPVDRSWQQSPLDWPAVSSEELTRKLTDFETKITREIVRVQLNFRSPRNTENNYRRSSYGDDDSDATEMNKAGLLIDPSHVLILAKLPPKQTSRLERVVVYPHKSLPVEGKFEGSLADYGGLVISLDRPLNNIQTTLSPEPVVAYDQKMLLGAEVRIQGQNKTVYAQQYRIASFELGWRRQLQPQLLGSVNNRYLFDLNNRLVALPLSRREKILSDEDRWSSDYNQALTAACYLEPVMKAQASSFDATNVPLEESQENRIAWLGVEMQPLDEELARINQVSDMTRDGEIGAIISFVYDNSPASQAGLEMGDILLRLHIDKQPRPMEVTLDDYESGYGEMFPWEQLSDLSEEYYDQLPTPWAGAENSLIRSLTDFGFGTHFQAEIFRNGEVIVKDMTIIESPSHYDSAKQFKSEALGITVRNLTYEVRRYFRLTPDDPGVIVSKIEPGSKASVGGIKPFEIITHVNDAPVADVEAFEKMIQAGGELKLSVKRMTKGRIVNLKMDAAAAAQKTDAAEAAEPNTATTPVPQ